MMGMKVCENCGYQHSRGRCCIDIYQQLGQTKGPSVISKVLLAFVLPLLIFMISLILASYILSIFKIEDYTKTLFSFVAALTTAVVFVLLIWVFRRQHGKHEPK
jgi:chromate transport protein ChrA